MDMIYSQLQAGNINPNKVKHQLMPAPQTAQEISAKRAADEFEAIFISQMLKNMSIGVKTDGPFGGGQSEEIYRELMNEELGKTMTGKGGIGLSDAIYREMLKTQEVHE